MKKLILFLTLIGPSCPQLHAATHFPLSASFTTATLSTSATHSYFNPDGGRTLAANDTGVACLVPGTQGVAWGYVQALLAQSDVSPGAGTSQVFILRKGTVPTAIAGGAAANMQNTNLVAGIRDTETTGTQSPASSGYNDSIYAHTVTISGGDFIDIASYALGTPAAMRVTTTLIIEPVVSGNTFHCANATVALNANNLFTSISGTAGANATESLRAVNTCMDQTLQNFSGYIDTIPGAATAWTATVSKNLAVDTPTVTWSNVTGYQTDGVNTVAFTQSTYDRMSVKWTQTGAPANTVWYTSAELRPTTSGHSCFFSIPGAAFSTTAIRFLSVGGVTNDATETNVQGTFPTGITIKGMYWRTNGNPTHVYAVTWEDNAADGSTYNTLLITGTTQMGSVVADFTPTAGHLYNLKVCPENAAGCTAGTAPNAVTITFAWDVLMADYTFATDACALQPIFIDFSAGTNGNTLATTALDASSFGNQSRAGAELKSITSAATFKTSSAMKYGGANPDPSCPGAWSGTASTVGVNFAVTTTTRYIQNYLYGDIGHTIYIVTAFRCADCTGGDTNLNFDILDGKTHTTPKFTNMWLQAAGGSTMKMGIELEAGCSVASDGQNITQANVNNGVVTVTKMVDGSDGTQGNRTWVFPYSPTTGFVTSTTPLVNWPGDESYICNEAVELPEFISYGYFGAAGYSSTRNLEFGWIKIYAFTGTPPSNIPNALLPQPSGCSMMLLGVGTC